MLNPDQFSNAFHHGHTELVPISILSSMKGNQLRYDPSKLSEDLKTNGFNEPGVIDYYQHDRKAVLSEGNHRLEAAKRAGFTHMPITVQRIESAGNDRGIHVKGIEPNQHNYVPGRLRPSDIMDIQ
jgi:hypothetical protein